MTTWQATQAKAKFSEVLDKASSEGPQLVKRRGTGYIVLTEEELRKRTTSTESFGDFLMRTTPRNTGVKFERLKGKPRIVKF